MVTIKVYECLNKTATEKPQFCLHSPWDWGGGTGQKNRNKKCFIPSVTKFYVRKGYLC